MANKTVYPNGTRLMHKQSRQEYKITKNLSYSVEYPIYKLDSLDDNEWTPLVVYQWEIDQYIEITGTAQLLYDSNVKAVTNETND